MALGSFAGYQLRGLGGKTIGVLSLYTSQSIPPVQHATLDGISSTTALVVQQAEADEQLQESNDRYNALFDHSISLVYLVNNEGIIVDINNTAFDRLGYTKEEIRLREFTSLLCEDQLPLALETARQIREHGNQKRSTEFRLRHKLGTDLDVEMTGTAVFSKGHMVAIQYIANDITDRKLADKKAKELMAELDRSNKELEQFAYVASHDLQEPLRMVSSYTQLLSKRYKGRLDADADEFISYAVDGANRMQGLINDLLAYSRVGTLGKVFKPTDCAAIFKQTLVNLRGAIEQSGAVVDSDMLPTVMADQMQIGQLLQNLVGNAIKYNKAESPRVHVSAEREGNDWLISVHDNGIGVDSQYADRIFVVFQRLHTREEFPGTGIGLAICKKIVERHGGHIGVKSQAGSGSTFYFTLPAGNHES
jgi:PAS domain S-box-containing protein